MAKIVEIIGAQNFGDYCIVESVLDNGETSFTYVGGDVECYFDPKHGIYKSYVKKKKEDNESVNKESM